MLNVLKWSLLFDDSAPVFRLSLPTYVSSVQSFYIATSLSSVIVGTCFGREHQDHHFLHEISPEHFLADRVDATIGKHYFVTYSRWRRNGVRGRSFGANQNDFSELLGILFLLNLCCICCCCLFVFFFIKYTPFSIHIIPFFY